MHSAAMRPFWAASWWTVVSMGMVIRAQLISSKPITEISLGTIRPDCCRPDIMPAASISAVANTAVISLRCASAAPNSIILLVENSHSNTRVGSKGISFWASAAR